MDRKSILIKTHNILANLAVDEKWGKGVRLFAIDLCTKLREGVESGDYKGSVLIGGEVQKYLIGEYDSIYEYGVAEREKEHRNPYIKDIAYGSAFVDAWVMLQCAIATEAISDGLFISDFDICI